ncbi:unnamed protein product, partial [Ascophyllum nodosum]
ILTAVGLIHVQVTGLDVFTKTAGILCSPVTGDDGIIASATCWEHGNWLQYFIAYLTMGVVFMGIEALRRAAIGDIDASIECSEADYDFKGWLSKEENMAEKITEEKKPKHE